MERGQPARKNPKTKGRPKPYFRFSDGLLNPAREKYRNTHFKPPLESRQIDFYDSVGGLPIPSIEMRLKRKIGHITETAVGGILQNAFKGRLRLRQIDLKPSGIPLPTPAPETRLKRKFEAFVKKAV